MFKNKISKSKVIFNVTSSNTKQSRKENTKKSHKVSYIVPSEKPIMWGGYYAKYCDIKHHYQNNVTPEELKDWVETNILAIFKAFELLQADLDSLYKDVYSLLERTRDVDTLRNEVSDLDVHIHGYR